MVACSTGGYTKCKYELMQQKEITGRRVPGLLEPILVLGGGMICIATVSSRVMCLL